MQQLKDSQIREAQLREQVAKSEPSTETGSLQKIRECRGKRSMRASAPAMLTLAMQLHDQYVDKGKGQRPRRSPRKASAYEEIIGSANDYFQPHFVPRG